MHVRTAGSDPAEEINPAAVEAMAEVGIDLSQEFPKPLTDEFVRAADAVITMGCGDACPIYPGKRYEDWELEDPAGKDLETVRGIRDEIEAAGRALAGGAHRRAGLSRPDLARRAAGGGPGHLRACVRRLRRDRRRRRLRRRPRHGRHRPGLRAGDHGHGLRDRPPLRRPHQPGRDAGLRSRPGTSRPARRWPTSPPSWPAPSPALWSCSPSGRTSRPTSAPPCPASAPAAPWSTRSILTALLMFVIMAVATDTRAVGAAAAIAIGGTVGLDALFGGPVTGASMNPARSIGAGAGRRDLRRPVDLHRRTRGRRSSRGPGLSAGPRSRSRESR